MKDPYYKTWKEIQRALNQLSSMILWLAKRLLSVDAYMEFVNEFSEEKADKKADILSELCKEEQLKKSREKHGS